MAKGEKYGVVLRRGMRYRFRNVVYKRNDPKLVSKEVRDHLVDDSGFFVDILLDAKGKAVRPKKKAQRARRAGSSNRLRVHSGKKAVPLMDTGESKAIPAIPADTGGAQEA